MLQMALLHSDGCSINETDGPLLMSDLGIGSFRPCVAPLAGQDRWLGGTSRRVMLDMTVETTSCPSIYDQRLQWHTLHFDVMYITKQ